MKTIFFSLLLLITINSAHSQDDWAPIGAKWYFSSPNTAGNPYLYVLTYESVADTVINGQACRKIIYSNNRYYYMYSENQKVYWWQYNQWYLVYDFSLNLNDTVFLARKAIIDNYPEDTIMYLKHYVYSLDTINVDGENFKRYNYCIIEHQDYPSPQWIYRSAYVFEKFGSEADFIDIAISYAMVVNDSVLNIRLRCYEDTAIYYITPYWTYYLNTYGYQCDYTYNSWVNNEGIFSNNFSVFPNPVENVININSEYDGILYIRNIFGETIKVVEIFEGYNIVEINDIPAGTLFLVMNNKSNRQYFKIIKL